MRLTDAHLHLQDPRLAHLPLHGDQAAQIESHDDFQIGYQLVNGTCPGDWPQVAELQAKEPSRLLAAYGVHPWRVANLPDDWESQLAAYLAQGAVSVGEIGLDNWIEPRDESLQIEVFEKQLSLAYRFNLPPSIHCLRAWDPLLSVLRRATLLNAGFLVHAFSGPTNVQAALLDLGASFSFSAYAASPTRKRMRAAIVYCPDDRILAETDAPDMAPHKDFAQFASQDDHGPLHMPAEILTAHQLIASLRNQSLEDTVAGISKNFARLFLFAQGKEERNAALR